MTTAPLESHWTTVDGLPMYARVDLNTAPPGSPSIVLVHGFVISSRYMEPIAQALAPHFQVYAPDLPGFGMSGDPPRTLDIPDLADALDHWMSSIGLAQAIFLGNSLGCQIVTALAVRHPHRVSHAILLGPTVERRYRSVRQQALRILWAARYEPFMLWLLQIPAYLRAGVGRVYRTARFAVADEIEARLPEVRAPTLVVWGEHDPIVSQAWAEQVTALLPHGRLVSMPGRGHAPNYSAPERLARVVCAFVADHSGAKLERTHADQTH